MSTALIEAKLRDAGIAFREVDGDLTNSILKVHAIVRQGYNEGISVKELARAAKLSRQRIYEIIKE